MKADEAPSTSNQGLPEAARTAHRIAEGILADLERTGRRAQADRLAEILLLLADGAPLTDPPPASSPPAG